MSSMHEGGGDPAQATRANAYTAVAFVGRRRVEGATEGGEWLASCLGVAWSSGLEERRSEGLPGLRRLRCT